VNQINSFIEEKLSPIYQLLLFGVLQVLNFVIYIIIRTFYRNEIFLHRDDKIHIFLSSKKAILKVFRLKTYQIIMFYLYQLVFCLIIALIFRSNIEIYKFILIHFAITFILFISTYFNDITVLNDYKNSHLDGIYAKIFLASFTILFYKPSFAAAYLSGFLFILLTVSNIRLILKGERKIC
jgi:hypothetical protein